MVRLKKYLSSMDENTKGWKEMYEGRVVVPANTPGNDLSTPITYSDTTYWDNDISYNIELTNKLLLDRPTILCMIPARYIHVKTYSTAVADDCYRQWCKCLDRFNEELYNRNKSHEETGWYYTAQLGGEVLVRNTAFFEKRPSKDYLNMGGNTIIHLKPSDIKESEMCLCMRFQVQLQSKNKKKAIKLLVDNLPIAVGLFINKFDFLHSQKVSDLFNKQTEIREWLETSEYCAFIANGSILARNPETGMSKEGAVPFCAPSNVEIEVCGIRGMGIKRGVTVITGGGYSGKSTLLNAISAGVYDHILGDGRELCITDSSAVSIAAEDGRCVNNLDISAFISEIRGINTKDFSSKCASGSTSQAANLLEAIDYGARLLLIDEDRSATNFMIKDVTMKKLIGKDPIIPYTERVNEIYKSLGISTILIIGGSGEYLPVADTIYLIDDYQVVEVTKQAEEIASQFGIKVSDTKKVEPVDKWKQSRELISEGFSTYPPFSKTEKLEISEVGYIYLGQEKIDISHIYEIISNEQRTTIGFLIRLLANRYGETPFSKTVKKRININDEIDTLYQEIEEKGLDMVYSGFFPGCGRFLALPRKIDLVATIYRMRNIKYQSS